MFKIALVAVVLLLATSVDSVACEPVFTTKKISLSKAVKRDFRKSDIVALVYASDIEKTVSETNVHFEILESFKGGDLDFDTQWHAQCCLCQMHFDEGQAYIVYATAPTTDQDFWYVDGYGSSKSIRELSPKELKLLRKLRK